MSEPLDEMRCAMSLSENQRAEVKLTRVARQLTTGGGKPGQGYAAVVIFDAKGDGASSMEVAATLRSTSHNRSHANSGWHQGVLMSSAEGSRVKTYRWPVSVRALTEREAVSGLSSTASCGSCVPVGRSSRTSPVSSVLPEVGTSASSSKVWRNCILALGDSRFSTRRSSESRSAADACSLSQVLQGRVSPKYSLSAKAAAGILRRAAGRGKRLPERLEAALVRVAGPLIPTA